MAIADSIIAVLNVAAVVYFKINLEPKKAILYDRMLEGFKICITCNIKILFLLYIYKNLINFFLVCIGF
jgi:hypothetical protein